MKILIIEDDPGIRQTLQDLLEISGHDVLAAATGVEGVCLAARRPELILCDIGLPGLDGYSVIEAIQSSPESRDVPFIFLTARADRDDQRRGMSLGADDYITKPFTAAEILAAIDARVRRQRPLRERIDLLAGERLREASANWSHELLTPLNGILGGLELIEMEADSIRPAELRELLGVIRQAAEDQLRLARKLLRHHELESLLAAPPANARPSACRTDAATAAGASRAAAALRRDGDLRLEASPGRVALPESFLSDAVAELVENALRHSPPGTPVVVTGRSTPEGYRIEVADTGPGLTAEQRARVGPYAQFEPGQGARRGLGLGLAIVRQTAQFAKGSLDLADGNGPAGSPGLRATLLLPVAP